MATAAANVQEPQADWELSKENFQPLKAGRRPGGLRDNTAELRKQLVDEQRQAFWEELASYKGDDPLDVWLRFIKWTQETFSAGGHKAELLPLLERCTRELQSVPKYQNDIRYLRVWVQYADCLPDPGDVFLFLKENEIGLEHALYYIAFATYLEFRGNYAKADSVYQQGINRLAAPVDRLKAKFQEFQHRMARRIARKAQEQQAGATEPEHPGRQTLGTIAARRPARGGLPGPAGLKRKAGASPPKAPGQENAGGGLSIFMDDEFQADAAPAQSAPAALFAAGRTAAGPWSKLGSFEQSRKENTQRPSAWAGQKLKQQPAHSAPAAPALEILVDPEFEEAAASSGHEAKVEPSLRQRLEKSSSRGGHMDEALASDPLRLHRVQPSGPAAEPSAAQPTTAMQPKGGAPPEVKRRREEAMAFDEAAMSTDGEELSFEELRARTWQSRGAAQPAAASTCYPGYEQQPAEEAPVADPEPEPAPEPAVAAPEAEQPEEASAQELLQMRPAPHSLQAPSPLAEQEPAASQAPQQAVPPLRSSRAGQLAEPTMTIATRDAFAAINNMFKGSLPLEHTALPPNPYAEPTMHYEPTMTLATRNAFAAINSMFKGSLPNEHGALPARSGPVEPTVTINTKAAFDAINSMFGGGRAQEAPIAGGGCFVEVMPRVSSSSPIVIREGGGGSFSIREDTQFIAPAARQPAAGGGSFSIREDTQFIAALPRQPAAEGGGFSIREDTQFIAPPSRQPAAGGFSIREDTQFLPPAPMQPAPAGGFEIRQDTQFFGGGGGFSVPEDDETGVLTVPDATAKPAGLHAHEAAEPVADTAAAAQVSKWGFAPGCDDTLQLELGDTQALEVLLGTAPLEGRTATASLPGASGLTTHMADLCISEAEGKENMVEGPRAMGRSIHIAQHAACALQPLDDELDPDAQALLEQQGAEEQDSFEVAQQDSFAASEAGNTCAEQAAAPPATLVDPFDPRFQPAMLASLEPPVLEWPGVGGCSAEEEAEFSTALRAVRKAGAPASVTLCGQAFEVSRFVGAGAYATVYQATAPDGSQVALKLEAPACPWEWYICQVVHARLPPAAQSRFIDPLSLALGPGASVLVAPYSAGGSLQDLINAYLQAGQRPDEVVAMHFAVEVLRLLEGLHAARVMHADIKPDNLLVAVAADTEGADENAAPSVQLQLIDFGRSIDLELLPPGTLLQGDSGTDAFRCVEMREGAPWLYQADAYGACGVVHCLLFGGYMEVDRVMDTGGAVSLRLRQAWKRYWAQELWGAFFSTLLNHTSAAAPPPAAALRRRFQDHLAANPAAQRKLQTELRRVAAMCRS